MAYLWRSPKRTVKLGHYKNCCRVASRHESCSASERTKIYGFAIEGKSKVFGISRGFRRLSVAVGLTGLIIPTLFLFAPSLLATGTNSRDMALVWLWLAVFFGGTPALFVLLVGWVVAGFRKAN